MKYFKFNNSFLAFFGDFSLSDFETSPIWYEYNDPDELVYLKDKECVSLDWLEEKLVCPLKYNDEHPYYTLINKTFLNHIEFSFIKCKVSFLKFTFDGYFSIINGNLNTLNIFTGTKTLCFYGTDFFHEDDSDSLKILSEYIKNKKVLTLTEVDYILDKSAKCNFDLTGKYQILYSNRNIIN